MNKKILILIITAIIAVTVMGILFFGLEKTGLNSDKQRVISPEEEMKNSLKNLTAPNTESILSPEEEAAALKKLTAPTK
jgi:hypothetical protein